MYNRLKSKKFKLITVCVDIATQHDKAVEILQSKSAAMVNLWINDGSDHLDKLNADWGFEVFPAVYMFDQSGKRIWDNHNDDSDVEAIEQKVVKLLEAG